MVSVPARTIVTDALMELGWSTGESIDAADADFALGKLNRLFDNWNAMREAVWASAFLTNTLTPNLSPHTIGPSTATWTVTQRPVDVVAASLVLNSSSPSVNIPINVRDAQWYQALSVPALATSIPTDLYYQPDWPNGKLFFWPVPTTAYSVQLLVRVVLADVTLDDAFWMPPGYRDAATLTLAEECAGPFVKVLSERTSLSAMRARARIFANNDVTPRLATQDAGMPRSSSGTRSNFNWLSGMLTK